MGYRTVNAAIVLASSFMFAGYASAQPATPEPKRETAAAPEAATAGDSCRQSGRTTMVRGDCPVDWDGQTVRISGTVDVTPGTSSKGPCLRLQTKDGANVSISSYGSLGQTGGAADITLLKNGDRHFRGSVVAVGGDDWKKGGIFAGSAVVCR